MSAVWRHRLGWVALTLVAAVVAMALVPVHLTLVRDGPQTVSIVDPSQAQPGLVRFPSPGTARITVVRSGLVSMALPLVPGSSRLPPERTTVVSGDWRVWGSGQDRMEASEAGAELHISGNYSTLEPAFATTPGAGMVRVQMGSSPPLDIDLDRADGFVAVRLDFGRSAETRSSRFAWHGHSAAFTPGQHQRALGSVGLVPIAVDVLPGSAATEVKMSLGSSITALAGSGLTAVGVLIAVALIVVSLLAIGALVERVAGATHGTWGGRAMAGLATLSLPVGFANYFLPVRATAFVVAGALLLLVLLGRRKQMPARPPIPADLAATSVVLAAGTWFVLTATRGWAVGYLQTDVTDYFNMTRVLWGSSAHDAGSDFGNGLRLIDFSLRSFVDGVLPIHARSTSIAVAVALLWVAAVAVTEMAERLGLPRTSRCLLLWTVIGSSALTALWTEGYFSRHMFALTLIAATAVLIVTLHTGDRRTSTWVWIGLAMAVPIAIVPTFVLVIIPVGLILIKEALRDTADGRSRRQRSAPFLALTSTIVLTAGPNMLWMRNIEVTRRYAVGTGAIGRFVVVPFHNTARFPATLLGLLPFHDNAGSLQGTHLQNGALPVVRSIRSWVDHSSTLPWLVAVVATCVLAAAAFSTVAGWADRNHSVRVVLVSTLAVTAAVGAASMGSWPSQAYTILMYFWTLAPANLLMAAVVIALAPDRARSARWAPGASRVCTLAVLGFLAVSNVMSSVLDQWRWFEPPVSAMAYRWNYDAVADVIELEHYLDNRQSPASFRLEASPGEITAGDTGRVLGNLLVLVLQERNSSCTNCARVDANAGLDWGQLAGPRAGTVLIVGDTRCPDGTPLVTGMSFALCTEP